MSTVVSRHLADTVLFDFAFDAPSTALERNAGLEGFIKRDLLAVVDEVFSEVVVAEQILHVSELAVDLGVVNYADYQETLPQKLRDKLTAALREIYLAAQRHPTPHRRLSSRRHSEYELIEYFLEKGRLPWSATVNAAELTRLLAEVIVTEGERLQQFLRRAPRREQLAARLARQFPETALYALLPLLAPEGASGVATLLLELKERWRGYVAAATSSASPAITTEQLMQQVWERLLEQLLHPSGARAPQPLLAVVLQHVFSHNESRNVGYKNIFAELLEGCGTAAAAHELKSVLHALSRRAEEGLSSDHKANKPLIERDEEYGGDTALLELSHEEEERLRASVVEAITSGIVAGIVPIWSLLLTRYPTLLEALLRHHGERSIVRTKIAALFPEKMIKEIVVLLEPLEHGFVETLVEHTLPLPLVGSALAHKSDHAKRRLWEFSLGYLFVERGSRFNKKSYLASLIRQLAANDNLNYQTMLRSLSANLIHLPAESRVTHELTQLFAELSREFASPPATVEPTGEHAIEAYDLYVQLRALFDPTITLERLPQRELAAVVERLARHYPWQLLRVLRELQSDLLPWERTLTALPASVAQPLVMAVLNLGQQGDPSSKTALMQAVVVNGARCRDQASYYRELIRCLLRGELIDFEQLITTSPTVGDGGVFPEIAEVYKNLQPPLPNTSTLADDAVVVRAALLSQSQPSATEVPQLIRSLERLVVQQPQRLRRLLEEGLHDATFVARLVGLLPESLLVRLLVLLGVVEQARLLQCAELLTSACRRRELVSEPGGLQRLKWQAIFSYLGDTGSLFNERLFVRRYIEALIDKTRPADPLNFRSELCQQLVVNSLPSTHAMTLRLMEAVSLPGGDNKRLKLPATAREERPQRESEQSAVESIVIHNAGLVLAAPYLPRLFERLALTEKSLFRSREAVVRGVHLLQFLVNERSASAEYLLVLNKLLCGIAIDDAIEREVEIDAAEQELLNGLLQGMIHNWKALGNTSVAGLRESFLQRAGRLQLRDEAWHLVVEPKPFDMLLDQIPWGYATIKFPWMERVIYVEWR